MVDVAAVIHHNAHVVKSETRDRKFDTSGLEKMATRDLPEAESAVREKLRLTADVGA